jgi:transposase
MMGRRLNHDQEQFFYSFRLDEAVPNDHPVREIAAVLDLSWVHSKLAPYYPRLGRPSIDPVLMMRMLIVGYVFAIRSERALCRDVRVNLAYRWFCGLSIRTRSRITQRFRGRATSGSAIAASSGACLSALWWHASGLAWSAAKASRWMPV